MQAECPQCLFISNHSSYEHIYIAREKYIHNSAIIINRDCSCSLQQSRFLHWIERISNGCVSIKKESMMKFTILFGLSGMVLLFGKWISFRILNSKFNKRTSFLRHRTSEQCNCEFELRWRRPTVCALYARRCCCYLRWLCESFQRFEDP